MSNPISYKVCVTTSDNYHHLLPVFIKLFNREWNYEFDLVGYRKPDIELPANCNWVSLGIQRGPKYFSDDLRPYFYTQPNYFVWLFEDSFIKKVNHGSLLWHIDKVNNAWQNQRIGRICLSREGMNRKHVVNGQHWFADPKTRYRLSTQPSIWNRVFLLKYLTPGLSPWDFELQSTDDNYTVMGPIEDIVSHNEGVTKKDIHKLNLEGIEL